jgi:hypothetical protein
LSIHTTLFFPLDQVRVSALAEAGWARGPYGSGPSAYRMPGHRARRTDFYLDETPLVALLSDGNRVHRELSGVLVKDKWRVEALEIVAVSLPDAGNGALAGTAVGYLIVHMSKVPDAAEIASLNLLGSLVRPGRQECRELLTLLRGASQTSEDLWRPADVPRVFALSLTETPQESDEGTVRWIGALPIEVRAASLMVLPAKASMLVDGAFDVDLERATPSFDVVVGRWAAVGVRRRLRVASEELMPVEERHVVRLRTDWTDAVLLELVERDALASLLREMQDITGRRDPRRWRDLERAFNAWSSGVGMPAHTDHPLERHLGSRLREELQTEHLAEGVRDRLRAHASAEDGASERRLTAALAALAVATAVLPLTLALAGPDWRTTMSSGAWVVSVALVAAAFVFGTGLWLRSFRPSKG